MSPEGGRTGLSEAVDEDVEGPASRDLGIELAEAPGRGVSRAYKEGLSSRLALRVDLPERRMGKVYLAAELNIARHGSGGEPKGQRADGAKVGRHVVAPAAVAPGDALGESPRFETEANADAVDFEVSRVGKIDVGEQAAHPTVELPKLLGAVGVVERQHGAGVGRRPKFVHRLPAHPLGWAVESYKIGIVLFNILELFHELVELAVGNLRSVLHVVLPLVVADLLPELLDAALRLGAHRSALAPSLFIIHFSQLSLD